MTLNGDPALRTALALAQPDRPAFLASAPALGTGSKRSSPAIVLHLILAGEPLILFPVP